MSVEEIVKTMYKTSDGKEFTSKASAEKHEGMIGNIKYVHVRYSPDLTEGRGLQKSGCIAVSCREPSVTKMFADYAACELFGNPVAFCMGVFGSNAIVPKYCVGSISDEPDGCILATVKDRFVDCELMEEGFTNLMNKEVYFLS